MLVKTKVFLMPGSRRAVMFLCPHGIHIWQLRLPIANLQRAGYSVVAYEFAYEVLGSGDPSKLIEAINYTRTDIQKQITQLKKSGHENFGFIGSSLGSFVIYNCMGDVPELSWGILNTGGDAAGAVWRMRTLREGYEAKGYDLGQLRKLWQAIQYPPLGNLEGKNILLIASHGDKTTIYDKALECFDLIKAAGPDTKLLVHKRLSHLSTVAYNLLRINKLVKQTVR